MDLSLGLSNVARIVDASESFNRGLKQTQFSKYFAR
jgi:hypothetical protein